MNTDARWADCGQAQQEVLRFVIRAHAIAHAVFKAHGTPEDATSTATLLLLLGYSPNCQGSNRRSLQKGEAGSPAWL